MSYPAYRTFSTTVSRVTALSPNFTRITLTGPDLVHFATDGLDQRIKLILPFADGTITDVGQFDEQGFSGGWYQQWRALPDEKRNPIRTYTVRAARPHECEIDVDFVLHGVEGPASAWASAAQPGSVVQIVGPDARAAERGGLEWKPGDAGTVLIAGDETAAPAICAIVQSLPAHVRGEVFVEVPTAADALPLDAPDAVRVNWLGRDGAPHGERLTAAVRAWGERRALVVERGSGATETKRAAATEDVSSLRFGSPSARSTTTARGATEEDDTDEILWEVPDATSGSEYAWLAGEAGTITALRRHLVRDLGIDRRSVAFMGYWRTGRAEAS
ncbi:siderophore-interacting protein [Microbacterium sp. KUDC0406]|uniref:siderophore-interacting protein n=1 Tax=Microbacterium sp. KUDC0406 TaxID=2909588 RepID=UPI001F2912E4|nr:siderophore-interacting protein [Microbacterium sp. KUDC0406]UJP09318.1 siderophore-interacting protein [Microbacterium sp. KUDC0406]